MPKSKGKGQGVYGPRLNLPHGPRLSVKTVAQKPQPKPASKIDRMFEQEISLPIGDEFSDFLSDKLHHFTNRYTFNKC